MMNEITPIVGNAVIAILVVFIGAVFEQLRRFLAEKAKQVKTSHSAEEYEIVKAIARTTVNAVEQIFKDIHGEEKFERAFDRFKRDLEAKGIDVFQYNLRTLIECAVKEMNETKALIESEIKADE